MSPSTSVASPDVQSPKSSTSSTARPREGETLIAKRLTWRVAVLCFGFAALLGFLIPIIDFKYNNTYLGSQHFAPGAIGALLLLVLVLNPLLGLLNRRWCLTRDEMLVVYLSCLFSALVAGIGGHNYWPSQIVGVFYYATPENKWMDVLRSLPSWMTPALDASRHYHPEIVDPFYTGLAPGQSIPWRAWIIPMLAWGSLPVATMVLSGCLSVILRAQWSEREALSFPLLKLPLEMTEDADTNPGALGAFFKNPVMWIGFGIAAFLQLVNGLNGYYPDVPVIATSLNASDFFTEAPWNQIGYVSLQVFPIAIGLSYLITAEMSFSLWFFFWVFKFQYVLAYCLGYQPNNLQSVMPLGTKVFTGYQEVGAYLAIVGLIFWTGREHFAHVARRALGLQRANSEEKNEALPYPLAFWGTIGAFAYLIGWATLAGAHPLVALTYWGSYVVISVVLSRVLADSGLLFISKIHSPLTIWGHLFGSGQGSMLGGIHSAPHAMMTATSDMRSCLMPSWVTALKLVSDRKLPARSVFMLCAGAMVISMAIAATMHVKLAYDGGVLGWANSYTPRSAPQGLGVAAANFARGEDTQGPFVLIWTAVGMLAVFGMAFLRSRFAWFPLHPTGYVMGQSWAMHTLWLSVFCGWLCKVVITRFAGHDAYRRAIPLFLGLALGDVAMMLFWLGIDTWQGHNGHILIP